MIGFGNAKFQVSTDILFSVRLGGCISSLGTSVLVAVVGGVVDLVTASWMSSFGNVVAIPYTAMADNDHQKNRFHIGVVRQILAM